MTFYFSDTVPTSVGTVSVAFTDASRDLAVAEGLTALQEWLGEPISWMNQIHGNQVAVLDGSVVATPEVDALVSRSPLDGAGALIARAADCVPIVLVADDGTIAAVHAGREGVRVNVAAAAVRAIGPDAGWVRAWIGPHICGGCYEVPEAMAEEIAGVVPAARARTRWGTPSIDLGAAVRAQLADAGVEAVDVGGCTFEDPRLHSYRRDGVAAGRHGGVVWRAT